MSDHLHQAIEAALAAVGYPEAPEGLYEPIRYMLDGGGKRLRPTLLLMAYDLYRPGHTAEAMPAAVGIEMYHNHTLLHDDLMDRADMRHGRPTVHKAWNDNTAILSGDTMLIMAAQHVAEARSPHAAEAMRLFLRSAREVCEGQQHDVNFERRADVTEEEYLEMIRLKTSVLLACAASLGAVLAGAPGPTSRRSTPSPKPSVSPSNCRTTTSTCMATRRSSARRTGATSFAAKKPICSSTPCAWPTPARAACCSKRPAPHCPTRRR